jgi:hypothetical protein
LFVCVLVCVWCACCLIPHRAREDKVKKTDQEEPRKEACQDDDRSPRERELFLSELLWHIQLLNVYETNRMSKELNVKWLSQLNMEDLAFKEKRERLERELMKYRASRQRCFKHTELVLTAGLNTAWKINQLFDNLCQELEAVNKGFAEQIEAEEIQKKQEGGKPPYFM